MQTHGQPTHSRASPLPISPQLRRQAHATKYMLFKKVLILQILCIHVGAQGHILIVTKIYSGTQGDQKRAVDAPELNLEVIVSLSFGTLTRSSARAVSDCNHGAISPETEKKKFLGKKMELRAHCMILWW